MTRRILVSLAWLAAPRRLSLAGRLLLAVLLVGGAVVAAASGLGLVFFLPYAGVGTLLAIRRPRTSIGWILLGLGWSFALVTMSIDATPEQFATRSLDPLSAALAVVGSTTGAVIFFLFALLAMVFPSGRLPTGRWGRIARSALGVGLVFVVVGAVMPVISVSIWGQPASVHVRNPAGLAPDLPIWQVITSDTAILPLVVLMIGAAVALLVRFRRATGVERQQLRWVVDALGFVVTAVVTGLLVSDLIPAIGNSGLQWLGALVAFPCVPIAIGIAILRYRLFEIDRIISRTIGWVVVTAILAAVFALVVVGLQVVLEPITENSTLAVASSTLVAAALFQPLRRRVQRVVDRRFNRARVDAQQAIDAFGAHLRDEVDLGALRTALVATANEAVRPVAATVWLRGGEGAR